MRLARVCSQEFCNGEGLSGPTSFSTPHRAGPSETGVTTAQRSVPCARISTYSEIHANGRPRRIAQCTGVRLAWTTACIAALHCIELRSASCICSGMVIVRLGLYVVHVAVLCLVCCMMHAAGLPRCTGNAVNRRRCLGAYACGVDMHCAAHVPSEFDELGERRFCEMRKGASFGLWSVT